MKNQVTPRPRGTLRLAAAIMLMGWLLTPALMAEVKDVRQEIAQESLRYRAKHFPDGQTPPKHDWRKTGPLRRGQSTLPAVPGGVGYGYYFQNNTLLWTNSTVADYYVIAPNLLGQPVTYLYLTSTCRAQLGTESLVDYDAVNSVAFYIYDWSQAPASPWQVFLNLQTDHPWYLTQRPDELAVTRQMVHIRNGTFYVGFAQGQFQWKNVVWLFNFTRGDWDLIYSYNYGTANLTDNLYGSGDFQGSWGPIVETFDTYTNVNPIGFDLIRLFQDGNPAPFWLDTTNSYVTGNAPWQLLTEAPNTSFTVGVNAANPPVGAYGMGTLCVTANTNAASFSLSPVAGTVASGWVSTPSSNSWDKIVVGLPPGNYAITFNPLPGLPAPAQQLFTIASNSITTVPAAYGVPPPNFQDVTLDGGALTLTWNSVTGLAYQVQYATDLNQTNWVDLGGAITASNAVSSATDSLGTDGQRFYRVQQAAPLPPQ